MSEGNDHDLLLRLDTKLDLLTEEVRRASNDTGYPRCAQRLARLEAVEDGLKATKNKLWWALGLAIAEGLGLITAFLKGGIHP